MPSDSAGKILETLGNSGSMDVAVKILGTMRDRQAAKVLAEMKDQQLAAEMVQALRGLKKPGTAVPSSKQP